MKKALFALSVVATLFTSVDANAQKSNRKSLKKETTNTDSSTPLTVDNVKFEKSEHDFGTIKEGPNVETEFVFLNTGNKPIQINSVRASCGCTTPSYSEEPVLPGKKGSIKAVYSTQGRPGAFTKSITVVTNAGTVLLNIKGNVEAKPATSVPVNGSVMKSN